MVVSWSCGGASSRSSSPRWGSVSATPRLALAVAAAGGRGLPGARAPAEALAPAVDASRTPARRVRRQLHRADDGSGSLELALERRPTSTSSSRTPTRRWSSACTPPGAVCGWQVETAEEARAAEAAGLRRRDREGVGVGRAQAGRGPTLLPLLDAVLGAVSVPVVAAGGIATARGVAAALAAGASGVRVGTRFIAAEESDAHPDWVAP